MSFPARFLPSTGLLWLLEAIDAANLVGDHSLVAGNLSGHSSAHIRARLVEHPRMQLATLPTGACWLNLIEG